MAWLAGGTRPVFDRSPRVLPAAEALLPRGLATREPLPRTGPGARGRGLRDVSVVDILLCLAGLAPGSAAADTEPLPDRAVAVDVLLGQVLQQPAAAADQQQQPAAAVVVVLVHLQVLGQVVDPPGQQRDLDFRRTGVTLTGRVLRQDLLLGGGVERHVSPKDWCERVQRADSAGARQPHEGAARSADPASGRAAFHITTDGEAVVPASQ